jgi:hypothetical protein
MEVKYFELLENILGNLTLRKSIETGCSQGTGCCQGTGYSQGTGCCHGRECSDNRLMASDAV